MKDYGDDLRIVPKHFVVHPQVATNPALAACAAHKQGKYFPMVKGLWEQGYDHNRDYSPENINKIATSVGLDMNRFKADMEGDCRKVLRDDQTVMSQVGTGGTPAFYINGRFLSGARPIEQFKALIDEELKKANERIGKDGVTAANYYDKWIMEKGKKKLDGT
jgi:predicted DsbA family dithiol-disulfide isomerase